MRCCIITLTLTNRNRNIALIVVSFSFAQQKDTFEEVAFAESLAGFFVVFFEGVIEVLRYLVE